MTSNLDETDFTPWTDTPGLYAIINVDGQIALDEAANWEPNVIHGWFALSNARL